MQPRAVRACIPKIREMYVLRHVVNRHWGAVLDAVLSLGQH